KHLTPIRNLRAVPTRRSSDLLLVGQPLLEELDEEPLCPLVVFRVAGDGLALPVEHRAHALELLAHVLDVGIRPLLRVDFALDGRDRKSTRLNSSHVKISYAVF